jgi:hypothetical protein
MSGPISTSELLVRLNRLEHKVAVQGDRFDVLANSFAKYWLNDNQEPGFAIVLRRYTHKGVVYGDLYVITKDLSRADMKLDKPMIMSSDESKAGKWEPFVLPLEIAIKLERPEKVTVPDDGNSALS